MRVDTAITMAMAVDRSGEEILQWTNCKAPGDVDYATIIEECQT
jgi:hypothetical protein